MKKEYTYNDVYSALALIDDLGGVKLPGKAMAEKLLLRVLYNRPHNDFEEIKRVIDEDKDADDETKLKSKTDKAGEVVAGFVPKGFSAEAFEQIVETLAGQCETIKSRLASPQLDDEGNPTDLGELPVELWLQIVAENIVDL